MPRVKVRTQFAIGELFAKFANASFKKKLGNAIVKEMKESIARGNSPVKGKGKFTRYAAQRGDAKSNYPKGISNKSVRPVNLTLTGDMLKDLKWKSSGPLGIKVGVMGDQFSQLKAQVHNSGERRDIPQRKFVPNLAGDEFRVKIQRLIKKIHQDRLNVIVKKSNKKSRRR